MNGIQTDRRILAVTLTVLALQSLSGFADGRFTDQADSREELDRVAKVLDDLPLGCGHWTAEPLDLNPDELKIAEASSAILRRYTSDSNGTLTVLLLCGRPGPISVHPPTACYKARGYRLSGDPCLVSFDASKETANVAEFINPAGFSEDRVGILWTWMASGCCSAPENPRLEFADQPALLKLYVTWDRGSDSRKLDESIPREFFTLFTADLKRRLQLSEPN